MDLGAYAQIDDLEHIMEENGISVPRLRGLRLMADEKPLSKEEIASEAYEVEKQYNVWNKYTGRDDVLYIHARIGGWNWDYYGGDELTKQPWFLEKVDDAFDSTYCDIYAKITKEQDHE